MKIMIESNATREFVSNLISNPDEIHFISKADLLEDAAVVQAIITLTTVTLPLVANIIIEHIKAKKEITIKFNGVEIKGISEKNIKEILSSLLKENNSEEE